LKTAHAPHGVTHASFLLVVDLLKDAMENAGVTPEDIEAIYETAKSTHNEIVSR
jgi:truncated hemoglobin YjbI